MHVHPVERLALVGPMFPGPGRPIPSDQEGTTWRPSGQEVEGSFPSCAGRRIAFKRTRIEA